MSILAAVLGEYGRQLFALMAKNDGALWWNVLLDPAIAHVSLAQDEFYEPAAIALVGGAAAASPLGPGRDYSFRVSSPPQMLGIPAIRCKQLRSAATALPLRPRPSARLRGRDWR